MSDCTGLNNIATSAAGPKSAKGDSGEMQEHSLPDQIAADRYLRSTRANRRGRGLGVRFMKIVPPGASGVDRDCR